MYKTVCYLLMVCLALSGCIGSASYQDDEVAAVVRGEEITVGYLRLLYPDDSIGELIDEAVQAKLAEQEIKQMKKDISEHVIELKRSYGKYPEDDLHTTEAQSIRSFADPQAKKLGMDPEKYYDMYVDISAERTAYINTYISAILGELADDEYGIEEYHHHANEVLDDLVERNKDSIKIQMK